MLSAPWNLSCIPCPVQAPYVNSTAILNSTRGVQSQVLVHPDLQIAMSTPAFAPMKEICDHIYANVASSLERFRLDHAKEDAEAVLVDFACVFHMLQTIR